LEKWRRQRGGESVRLVVYVETEDREEAQKLVAEMMEKYRVTGFRMDKEEGR